jgi:hypothetical protein
MRRLRVTGSRPVSNLRPNDLRHCGTSWCRTGAAGAAKVAVGVRHPLFSKGGAAAATGMIDKIKVPQVPQTGRELCDGEKQSDGG